ncbi:MlaD family protein [Mycolicibacter kumamotonensis]|nr:MlaD family protein [Mycolicibacter kumamotonensis]
MMSFVGFGLLMALGAGYVSSLGVHVRPPADRTDLTLGLADISGLERGSKVLLRGVEVGEVSNISVTVEQAHVAFYVRDRFQIPIDTDVRVENLSALDEAYINLVPLKQGGPYFEGNERIPSERVIQPASVSELATSVVRVLNQLDPDALRRITEEADAALPPPAHVLPNLTRTSRLLRNAAAGMHGRGREVLDNFQTLLQDADWVGPLLGDLSGQLYDAAPAVRQLFSAFVPAIESGMPEAAYKFDHLIDRIQGLLDTSGTDLKLIGDRFKPHIVAIGGTVLNFDTAEIFSNMLDTIPADGLIKLRVNLGG